MIYTFLDPVKSELGKRLMTPVDGKFISAAQTPADNKRARLKEARLKIKHQRQLKKRGISDNEAPTIAIPPERMITSKTFQIPDDATLISIQGILRGSGDVLTEAIERKIDWIYLDHGYLGKAHRICLNNTVPTKYAPNATARFEHKTDLKHWVGGHGSDILVLPPSLFYTEQFELEDFLFKTVLQIAKHTDRKIVIRPKPHHEIKAANLEEQLRNTYCIVTWGSALALQGLIRGIPVISLGNCPTKPLSFKFTDLETARMGIEPDRRGLLNSLTWNLYDTVELPRAYDIIMSRR
jgi:hypothetical protein